MTQLPDRLTYRVSEVAQEANVTPGAIYNMIRRGEIEICEFGRSKRIPARERKRLLKIDDA